METLHLYCFIGDGMERDLAPLRLDGRQVFAVRHRDLSALVSSAPGRAYKAMKREEALPHLFAHQAVIEQVMTQHTVVPVKFGTTARDETEVRKILERGYPLLSDALEAMEGKIELDVVALWSDLDSLLREIGQEEEIGRAKTAIAARPACAACLSPGDGRQVAAGRSLEETREERVQIGKMVKARLDQRRDELSAEILEALEGLAQDVCPHALLHDGMIFNAALLVERSKEGEVDRALARLDGRYAGRVDFRCVGPLPPYSFSTVEIRRFEAEQIERARRLLGLGDKAGPPDVKAAYRRLVRQCHPDTAPLPQGRGEHFEQVTLAYRMLADYYEAAQQAQPGTEATGAVAVKLFRYGAEAGVA